MGDFFSGDVWECGGQCRCLGPVVGFHVGDDNIDTVGAIPRKTVNFPAVFMAFSVSDLAPN